MHCALAFNYQKIMKLTLVNLQLSNSKILDRDCTIKFMTLYSVICTVLARQCRCLSWKKEKLIANRLQLQLLILHDYSNDNSEFRKCVNMQPTETTLLSTWASNSFSYEQFGSWGGMQLLTVYRMMRNATYLFSTVAQKGHVHYQFQHFQLPVAKFEFSH